MTKLIVFLQTYLATMHDDDRGASLVEYALLVALIALAAIGAIVLLGGAISDLFTDIAGRL